MTEYFSNIKDVLKGASFRTLKTNYSEIIENWDDIVGKKYSDKTEIGEFFSKMGKTYMLVYAKSSPISQELSFFKHNIIKKIREKYNTDIADIIIKTAAKSANYINTVKETEILETYTDRPDEQELNDIILDENIVQEIKESVEKQSALSETQKMRMFDIIIEDLKTQEWMKKNGFPVCKKCGRVMTIKTFGEENICNICKKNTTGEM